MISLLEHIQYLLTVNDCVIVPEWGAFIVRYHSASISDGKYVGPYRELSFNPVIRHDDGLLASSIVRREGVSYDAAMTAISNGVEQMRNQLEASGRLTLARIGTFERNSSGAMLFAGVDSVVSIANKEYMYLPALEVEVHAEEELQPEANVVEFVPRKSSLLYNWMRVAASIAVLIVLCAVISTPVAVNRGVVDYAGISAPSITKAKILELPFVESGNGELYISMPDRESTTEVVDTVTPAPVDSVRMVATDRYFLVVASLDSRRQAERYIAHRPDEKLAIMENEGRFRVYAATGKSVKEARSLMVDEEFASIHPDAWVCRWK